METPGFEAAPERKRKRQTPQFHSGESAAGKSEEAEAEDTTSKTSRTPTTTPPLRPPGDEEVEEFFAILRRMHAAVKQFGNGNGNRRWTALDSGLPLPAPPHNGGAGQVKKVEQKAENCVSFDLNAVPLEAAESNGD